MTRNHLKARAAPRTWNIPRKEETFIVRPNPGSQKIEFTQPLGLVLRVLSVGNTKKEINHILRSTPILVNGVRRWDYRYGVGFMDTVAIPESKQYYVLSMDDHGRLTPETTSEKLVHAKHAQVRGVSIITSGKLQLQLTDGRTVLVTAKNAKDYPTGATAVIDLTKKTVASVHPVASKAHVILTSGKHRGKRGTVEAIDGDFVTVATKEGSLATKKSYAFVLTNAAAGGAQ
jgi:small subunit ribosomal protein S4e